MGDAAVELKVAGKTYSVVTSAAPEELHRLAAKVEGALVGVSPPGREASAQALVLAAITLAHELEQERAARLAAEQRHRAFVESMLQKVDAVLGEPEEVFVRRGASQFKKSRSV